MRTTSLLTTPAPSPPAKPGSAPVALVSAPASAQPLNIFKHYWRDSLQDAVLHQGHVYILHQTFEHEHELNDTIKAFHWSAEDPGFLTTHDTEGYKLWLEHFCPVHLPYVRGNTEAKAEDPEEPALTQPHQLTWDWLDQHLP